MLTFSPNTDVVVEFDLVDPHTTEIITPTSAAYSVYDDEGTALQTNQLVTISGGEDVIRITVAAVDNDIGAADNGARSVTLNVVTDNGAVTLSETYVLEQPVFLTIPAQSAMTVPQSMMLSRNLAQTVIEVWGDVEDRDRKAALLEAWTRIAKLPLTPWRDYEEMPDAASDTLISGRYRVDELDATDWALLPDHFKNALKRAQLIEACVLLDGDPTWDRRQDGLISKTVGESSEMFVNKKSAISSVSPKAYREISQYVRRRITLGRA